MIFTRHKEINFIKSHKGIEIILPSILYKSYKNRIIIIYILSILLFYIYMNSNMKYTRIPLITTAI